MTNKQKAARLRLAMAALEQAEAWVKQAMGDTDVGEMYAQQFAQLFEDLTVDTMDLEEARV